MFALSRQDDEYVNRPGGRDSGSGLCVLLMAIILLMAGFLVWASFFELEEVTRALGRVVPSSQVQSVQAPEGGVVSVISVREGDVVEPGQVLFPIDDTGVQSSLGELRQRLQALLAELVRLNAEADSSEKLEFPDDHGWNSRVVAAEQAVFATRRQQLSLELDELRDRLAQRQAEVRELVAQQERLMAVVASLRQEVKISEELFADGTFSEIEILRLRGELARVEGDIVVLAAQQDRAQAGVAEIETQTSSARSAYELTAKERISVVLADLAIVEESLIAARDRVSRTGMWAQARLPQTSTCDPPLIWA